MRIEQPGPVTDRITLLGRNESCVYLVDGGEEMAILGGGMGYMAPDILTQTEAMGVDPRKIRRLIIHHAHFDHVGAVPYLKQHWPWLRVTASRRGRELLSRPDVVASIVSLNLMLLPEDAEEDLKKSLDIETIPVDDVLSDGDRISCGSLAFEAVAVPGHSSCSMAIYMPSEKVLSASDAGGIPYGDKIFAAANSNFDRYQASLETMAGLDTRVHLSEHYGAVAGEEGRTYMARSIVQAGEMRALLETTYDRLRDQEKTVEALLDVVAAQASGYFLPREIMTMVLGQMTRFIARQHQGDANGKQSG